MKSFYFSWYLVITMKRLLRGLCLIGILLVVFVQFKPVMGSPNNRRVIYTAITNISLTNITDIELCENCTHFDFLVEYEILNPRIRKLTLTFPCLGRQLIPNISISFEDNNYTAVYADTFSCLRAISHRTFDPGITSAKTSHRTAILDQNFTELPNGEYTFLIYGRGWSPSVVFNETVMTISDEGTHIQYGTLPPLDIIPQKRSLVFIHTGLVLAFVFVLLPKRKRKKSS
ncbi:MAG: hypothetical protein KGD59_11415 [Candidatus Heimdallarchaeota archaeon]|nr:hypothetical protein [Candidatus Heimdallarchaeota archaeon]MBY8995151.1 hypothetical protein [Candidatus Heimdallarchaeota archaeon]